MSTTTPDIAKPPAPDVLFRDEGTVCVFCPLSERAKDWFEENVKSESWQWLGASLVVDRRFAWGLLEGLRDAEMVIE